MSFAGGGLITGIAIAGGVIAFAWIGGGYLDRIDDAFDEVTDADSRTAAFVNEVRGVKAPAELVRGGEANRRAGAFGNGSQTQFKQTNSTSNQPANGAGQGSK